MKPLTLLASALLITLNLSTTQAEETNSAPTTISALVATNYFGKQVIVTGIVAQVSSRASLTFLNFEKKYPDSPFAVIIRNKNTNDFDNLAGLKGKAVAVEGKIKDYNGRAEMELTQKSQLKLLSAEQ